MDLKSVFNSNTIGDWVCRDIPFNADKQFTRIDKANVEVVEKDLFLRVFNDRTFFIRDHHPCEIAMYVTNDGDFNYISNHPEAVEKSLNKMKEIRDIIISNFKNIKQFDKELNKLIRTISIPHTSYFKLDLNLVFNSLTGDIITSIGEKNNTVKTCMATLCFEKTKDSLRVGQINFRQLYGNSRNRFSSTMMFYKNDSLSLTDTITVVKGYLNVENLKINESGIRNNLYLLQA